MVRVLAQGYGMSFSARTLQDAAAGGGGGGLGAYLYPNGVYDSFAVGTIATTTWNARNTGEIQIIGIGTTNYTWLTGGGTNADYEIRWDIISTTPTTGVTGSWINMSVGEIWSIEAIFGIKSCQGFVQIRQVAAPNTILAGALVTLNAESEP
jgi:hypothetical protein